MHHAGSLQDLPCSSITCPSLCKHRWYFVIQKFEWDPVRQMMSLEPTSCPSIISFHFMDEQTSQEMWAAEVSQLLQLPPLPVSSQLLAALPRSDGLKGRAMLLPPPARLRTDAQRHEMVCARSQDVKQDTYPAVVPGATSSPCPSPEWEEATTRSCPLPSTCFGQRGIQVCGLRNAIPCLGQSWGAVKGSSMQEGKKALSPIPAVLGGFFCRNLTCSWRQGSENRDSCFQFLPLWVCPKAPSVPQIPSQPQSRNEVHSSEEGAPQERLSLKWYTKNSNYCFDSVTSKTDETQFTWLTVF